MKSINLRFFVFLLFAFSIILSSVSLTGSYYTDNTKSNGARVDSAVWNSGKVTITEVLYDPEGTDAGKEFVELYNSGGQDMDLTGYILDFGAPDIHYVMPNIILKPKHYIVVHNQVAGENTLTDLFWQEGNLMYNTAGAVSLFRPSKKNVATIADFVQWGSPNRKNENIAVNAGIWPDDGFVPLVSAQGLALVIKNRNKDLNNPNNWYETAPTPGY